ncbi:hypothetical protein [Bifidobacterium leontopitheci]|uniref:Uncharacterized protein n=1 Tax=Bifidobacterium leontopitheci TaxID=2650774 RepID=A0A6I1GPM5_9BIFI|nr:hypothetical protein [Bifidobacterium leontopitheci]KAB7790038.1 hypothetical protein F7D09_1456 [Bifidobacterium leontopitheci]
MSREFLDEYFSAEYIRSSHAVRKPARQFGPKAIAFIRQCIAKRYGKNRERIPADGPQSVDECLNQFLADRGPSMMKKMDKLNMNTDPKVNEDAAFRSYVRACVNGWFQNINKATEYAKTQGAIRKHLERDHRFTYAFGADGKGISVENIEKPTKHKPKSEARRWGVVGGEKDPSEVPLLELKMLSFDYPIDIDPKVYFDTSRQRKPNYGKNGQMSDMLYAILKAAHGTLDLNTLTNIVQYRLAEENSIFLLHDLLHDEEDSESPQIAASGLSVEDIVMEDPQQLSRNEQFLWLAEQINNNPRSKRTLIRQHQDIIDMLNTTHNLDALRREMAK